MPWHLKPTERTGTRQEVEERLMEAAVFTCSICGEESKEICAYCTKDACSNHLCERCRRCSDCCHCDMPLTKASKETRYFSTHFVKPEPLEVVAAEHNGAEPLDES